MNALQDALRPLADMAEFYERKSNSHVVTAGVDKNGVFHLLNVGHLRAARTAFQSLNSTPDPTDDELDCPPPGWNGLAPSGWEARS